MGLTASDILNPINRALLFVKIYYIEDSTLKYLLYSDRFKSFSNGDIPEVRLDAVPFFKKEFDPIENNVIVQSTYRVILNNADDELSSIFDNKIFNNQKVEFYLTTENSSDEMLIATALIDTIKITDRIELNLKEINELTKKSKLNQFTDSDETFNPDIVGTPKKVIAGELQVECENTNVLDGDVWRELDILGKIKKVAGTNYYRLYLMHAERDTDIDALKFERLRKTAYEGDKISIKTYENTYVFSVASSLYVPDTTDTLAEDYYYINLQVEKGEVDLFAGDNPDTTIIEELNGNIMVQSDDGVFFNDEYHVSDNQTSTYEETRVVGAETFEVQEIFRQDDNTLPNDQFDYAVKFGTRRLLDMPYITLEYSADFLKENDRVNVVLQKFAGGQWRDYTEEEIIIDYYVKATKRAYFKTPNKLSNLVLKTITQSLANHRVLARYEKVQKITVEDKTFENKKNYFDIKITNNTYTLDQYPMQPIYYANQFGFEIGLYPSYNPIISIMPTLRVKVKRNVNQQLAIISNVFRAQQNTGLQYTNTTTAIGFAFGTSHNPTYYNMTENVRLEMVYGEQEEGAWKQVKNIAGVERFNPCFFMIRIKTGTATYQDLLDLNEDPNCPFLFSLDGGSAGAVINFDATCQTNALDGTGKIMLSSGNLANFSVGDEIFVRDGSNTSYAVVKSKSTDHLTLHENLSFTPAIGSTISKRYINEKTEGVSGTVIAGATVKNYLKVAYSDFIKFKDGDVILIKNTDNDEWVYRTIYTADPSIVGEYRLTFSPDTVHNITTGTTFQLKKSIDTYCQDHFQVPGYFSADVNVRRSLFNEDNTNTTDKRALIAGERPADILIRKKRERHKLLFSWYLENASNDVYYGDDDVAFQPFQANIGVAKNPKDYIHDEFKPNMNKLRYSVQSSIPRIHDYATMINMCPDFSLAGDYPWATAGLFGYVIGTTESEKKQAMAQAMAQKINDQIAQHFETLYGDACYKLPIVAVGMFDGTNWIVRVKHCDYSSCPKVNTDFWDQRFANAQLSVVQAEENYCTYVPYISNNNLYVKLDRVSLSIANDVKNYEYMVGRKPAGFLGQDGDYVDERFYFNLTRPSKMYINQTTGNGWDAFLSPFDTAIDANPFDLLWRYMRKARGQIFNVNIPLAYSKKIGKNEFERQVDIDKFSIVRPSSTLVANHDLVVVEKSMQSYDFKRTAFDDDGTYSGANEEICYSVDNYVLHSNWFIVDSATRDVNLYKCNYYEYHNGKREENPNRIVSWLELGSSTKIIVHFKDSNTSIANCLRKALSAFDITNYDNTVLNSLPTDESCNILIKKDDMFYKVIQGLLLPNNIVCFTDKDGDLIFEKMGLIFSSAVKSLAYYDLIDLREERLIPQYTKIIVKYGLKEFSTDDEYEEQEILNTAKNADFVAFGLDNKFEFESTSFNEITNADNISILVQKFTEENDVIEFETDSSHIALGLNDSITLQKRDGSTANYLIFRVETNFYQMKFKAIKQI